MLSKNIRTKINRPTVLPVGLYCHDTWSATVREEHRLQVFKITVLRKMRKANGVASDRRLEKIS
jgi:hypothetical protein